MAESQSSTPSKEIEHILSVELKCDPTINFAAQQNDIPIVKQIRISNQGSQPFEDLRLRLTGEPEFFPPWETTLSLLPEGGSHVLGPIDLRPSPEYLMGVSERIGGQLHLAVVREDKSLLQITEPIEVLAFDEWSGLSRCLPELLAAFVLPNHASVEEMLRASAEWLGEKTGNSALSGYQTQSPERVGQITQAIYSAALARNLNYCNPPASFELFGQKIRLPHRILEHQLGTCLDLALLMAACIEQAGLNPLIVMTEGHAFVGVWLVDECFADCATDDVLRLRKRVDLKEILVFETTRITSAPPNDFVSAMADAERHLLDQGSFQCALDIHRCRKSQVRPLPIRTLKREIGTNITSAATTIEEQKIFDLDLSATQVNEQAVERQTAATRLDRWKRKLLDLTMHNRLLNFRASKKTVQVLCPDLDSLEDSLADGLDFRIRPRPAELEETNPRSAELHRLHTGQDRTDEFLRGEFEERRLYTDLSDQELSRRLTEIFRTARTAMEEGGTSALYLAVGFLAWYQSESSEQRRLAPLILVPVELRRPAVQDGFRFCQSDEEPRINTTLLELLAKDFGRQVAGMDPIPQDEHGVDVRGILRAFRQIIVDTPRWDVIEEARIGFFSFTKFLMWRDLEERTDELLRNKVVDHLINHANEPYPDNGGFPNEEILDDTHPAENTLCPLPSDASQLAAVHAAAQGKSFVLFGPPGTGKSQTITNLIAHSLANGKSVLFVSEKMAALNVVFKRLTACGLGPFCLELHSNKTQKRHVIEQLGESLDHRAARSPEEWARLATRLTAQRSELNVYVRTLHQPRPIGESVFGVTSRLIGLKDTARITMNFASPQAVSRDQLDGWRSLIERIEVAANACGHPAGHTWFGCGLRAWSPATQREIERDLDALFEVTQQLKSCVEKLVPMLRIGDAWSGAHLQFADKFLRFITSSPRPPLNLLLESDWGKASSAIDGWINRGRERDRLRKKVLERYEDRLLDMDLGGMIERLTRARNSWFVPRLLGVRAVRKMLSGVARKREKIGAEGIGAVLLDARALRGEDQKLREADDRASALLGPSWKDGEADWDEIQLLRDWCEEYRKLAVAASRGSPEKSAAYRKHWANYAIEGSEALQPSGSIGQEIAEFFDAHTTFKAIRAPLEARLVGDANTLWGNEARRVTLEQILERVTVWKSNLTDLRAWCNWQEVKHECIEAGLSDLVAALEEGEQQPSELRRAFDRCFYEAWLEAITDKEEVLRRFFSPEHERKIRSFRDSDDRYLRLTRAEIQARLAAQRPVNADRVNDASEIGIVRRQRRLRRGHMPVRRLFQRISHLLPRLKPCLLMSPISVAQYLDPAHPPFDLVVFDEASQILPWDAAGSIARGDEVVIVGDPKQLPPTNFFQRAEEQEENEDDVIEELDSILDECLTAGLPQMRLRWHYRSRHESLIAFSNHYYYDNNLLTFPSPAIGQSVIYRHVPSGVYDKGLSRTNRGEADAVVAEVVSRLGNSELSQLSIGIVTFSLAQQVLIEDLLDEARRTHPEIEPFFSEDISEPVFVKNLENVQGDERDVILFSVCYGPDKEGRISMNFGPLNRDGGERRLNVAITRARQQVIVFATVRCEQIDLSRTRALGVQHLKCFLDYAERGPVAISQATTLHGGSDFDSPFEKQVCERLRGRGFEVHSQVGCSGYRIDLAIVDPEASGRYLLGIECDGANYHSAKTARDRDRLREDVLRGLGWQIHRVWSTDWWANPEDCLEKIEAAIETAKLSRAARMQVQETTSSAPDQDSTADVSDCDEDPVHAGETPVPDGPPIYRAFRVTRTLGDQQAFYQNDANRKIGQLIERIVEHEGPVLLDLVVRRVAAHWGLTRRGPTICDRVEALARTTNVQWVTHGDSVFLWVPGADPTANTRFRVPGSHRDDQRDVSEIPPEEIAAAGLHVLTQQISLPFDAWIRECALLMGFKRCGPTIRKLISTGLEIALDRGVASREASGRVGLV